MKIAVKIKGVDDFEKLPLNNGYHQYQHAYPEMEKGDLLIYYYPSTNAVGFYEVHEVTGKEIYNAFNMYKGTMIRSRVTPQEFVDSVLKNDPDLAEEITYIVTKLVEKYHPQKLA